MTAASRADELRAILAARMEVAIGRVRELVATADAALVDDLIEVGWLDLAKWRSTEATAFWVNTFAIVMCAGEPRHLEALRRDPGHIVDTGAHRDVRDARALAARVVELRAEAKDPEPGDDVLPKTKNKLVAHVLERLGDRGWTPGPALVGFAREPRFKLESFAGLAVYAALLLHADRGSLRELTGAAVDDPIIAAICAARGIAVAEGDPALAAELLALVYAEPENDAARAIYADYLMERGDGRGEFIGAQLDGQHPAVDEAQQVAWAGAVGSVLRYRAPFAAERPCFVPRYRRGFLSGARVDHLDGSLADAPEWSVVELLDVAGSIAGIGDHDLRSLRALGLVDAGDLEAVAGSPIADQLEAVGVGDGEIGAAELDTLAKLPCLRALIVGSFCRLPGELFDHPLIERLEFLGLDDDIEVPAEVRRRTAVVALSYGNNNGGCLPFYNELIVPRPAAATGDEALDPLWARIAADPDDLDAREAYGAVLSERGDPRGELIALQCARARDGKRPTRREKELLAEHGERWLGPLAAVALKSGLEFHAGFVRALRYDNRDNAAVAGAREWATVRSIDVRDRNNPVAPVLLDPVMSNLRSVVSLPQIELLALLERAAPLAWTHLGIWGTLSYFGAALRESQCFTALEHLDLTETLRVHRDGAELLASPFAASLRRVSLHADAGEVAEHLAWMPAHLQVVDIGLGEPMSRASWRLRFTRATGGWSLAVEHASGKGDELYAELAGALGTLDPDAIRDAAIEAPKRIREAAGFADVATPALERLAG